MEQDEILGFDPASLNVFNESQKSGNAGNSIIYKTRPAESKSEDGVYRSTIKVIWNPFDKSNSIFEQQTYGMTDANGWFSVVSALTLNDPVLSRQCPIFKAWKQCHYAAADSKLKGQESYFQKSFGRYCLIQVMSDKNHPELEGQYMIWKLPKSVWDIISSKLNPSTESGKAPIPVLDYLVGRSIDLEVSPGPGKPGEERYSRETKYMCEISEDVTQCVNPDMSSMLNADEQEVVDTYVAAAKKVWKCKDAEERKQLAREINRQENTKKFVEIHNKVEEKIKKFCPNLVDELGYKEWSEDVKKRVENYINIVLSGNDPKTYQQAPAVLNDLVAENTTQFPTPGSIPAASPASSQASISDDDSDLPF